MFFLLTHRQILEEYTYKEKELFLKSLSGYKRWSFKEICSKIFFWGKCRAPYEW